MKYLKQIIFTALFGPWNDVSIYLKQNILIHHFKEQIGQKYPSHKKKSFKWKFGYILVKSKKYQLTKKLSTDLDYVSYWATSFKSKHIDKQFDIWS